MTPTAFLVWLAGERPDENTFLIYADSHDDAAVQAAPIFDLLRRGLLGPIRFAVLRGMMIDFRDEDSICLFVARESDDIQDARRCIVDLASLRPPVERNSETIFDFFREGVDE